jgi:hypothetical protein
MVLTLNRLVRELKDLFLHIDIQGDSEMSLEKKTVISDDEKKS